MTSQILKATTKNRSSTFFEKKCTFAASVAPTI